MDVIDILFYLNKNYLILFQFIDEVWVYGNYVSSGMQMEIEWAIQKGIPVIKK